MTSAAPLGSSSGAVSDALAKVESQLASFWTSSYEESGSTVAKVRASTLNYVVLCAPQDADAYREATERLSETHGGRMMLLTMSGRIAPWEVLPDIHAVCRIDAGVPICYDRIDLTFGAVAASRAASVVRSLALPELDTVIEVGAGAPAPLVEGLAGKFDRLIVDSGKTSVNALAKIVRDATSPVADRGMIRAYAWRELTARFFDDALPALKDVRRVEIARTAPHVPTPTDIGGGTQDPAPVFLGWLASRLGWTFTSHTTAKGSRGEPIEIALINDDRADVGPAQLTAVRLRCGFHGEPLDCTIERTTSAAAVRWKMRGARNADREAALGHHDETWVAVKAIDATEGDEVTRQTLLAAADWEVTR